MNLTDLKKAAEVATPGPWECEHNSWDTSTVYGQGNAVAQCPIDGLACEGTQERYEAIKEANAKFITLANPATVLKLIAVVEAAKKVPISYHAQWPCYTELQAALKELDHA